MYLSTENTQTYGTESTRKSHTYFYGKDHTLLQNFPHIREFSFWKPVFKNIYYQSTQYDLKDIENKIGRDGDPLFDLPYFQVIIKTKQQIFDRKCDKWFKAHYKLVVKSMATGTTNLNKSMAHSGSVV